MLQYVDISTCPPALRDKHTVRMSSMPSTAQLYAIFKRDVHKFTKWCQIYQLFSSHLPDEVQTLYQLALVKQLQQGQGRD